MDELVAYSPSLASPHLRLVHIVKRLVDWQALVVFFAPFLLYLRTLAPTIYNLDSAELTTAAATGGILRATGYPLYLVLGRLWALLPVGDVGFRLNLFSAFCAALTILLLDLSLRRLRVGLWARLGALGLLASAPFFWAMSLIAEVYTLHTALMAGLILACLRWRDQPSAQRLALIVFLFVLSMGNHAATVLLAPGLLWFLLATAGRELLHWRALRLPALAAILAASVFLTLPMRHAAMPAFNYAGEFDAQGNFVPINLQSLRGLFWLLTGRSFAGQMFGYDLAGALGQLTAYGTQLWQAFFGVGMGPGLLGAVLLWRRDRALGVALSLLFLANVIFYANYRVVDKNTMFLPTYTVWAIWLGYGFAELVRWLRSSRAQAAARLLLVTAVLLAIGWNWQRVDLSDDWSAREQGEELLATVAPNAIVLGWWDMVPVVQYLQLVEKQRPDVLAINRFLISGRNMDRLIHNELGRRPIYISSPPPDLLRFVAVERAGPLYRLYPKPSIEKQEDQP